MDPDTDIDLNKRYPLAVALPILSFISIALCSSPLILHAKNRNVPATALICWSILLNIFNIINSLIWPNDNIDFWWDGKGLCDIEVKIMVASYVAVPGCLVGMFRSLAMVMDTSRATWIPSKTQRWRNMAIDLLFCVVVPIIAMITHVVWQKSRYLLYSISGPVINLDESWVSLVLGYIWPLIICLIAAYYCCLVLVRLYKYRSDFVHILRSRGSTMNKSGFLRLFLLAFTMLLPILPVQVYVVYFDLSYSLPWHQYSWGKIHGPQFDQIIKVPTYGMVFFDRWIPVAAGFMIFIFFGFGHDATKMYRTLLWNLGFGYCFPSVSPPVDSQATATVPAPNASNSTTLVGSAGGRAKSFFKERSFTRTVAIATHDGSYNDIEKGRVSSSQPITNVHRERTPWYRSFFNRRASRQAGEDTLLDDLSVPSQTVHTSAWAGVSQSRASNEYSLSPSSPRGKDFIHVKHAIRQQSEIQL